jgi:hypothetical protein
VSPAEALRYGWQGFLANVQSIAIIAVVVIAVQVLGTLLVESLQTTANQGGTLGGPTFSAAALLAQIATLVISLIVALGLIRAALTIVDGGRPQLATVFSTEALGTYVVASLLYGIGVLVGLVMCIIPGLIIAVLWTFYGYAIADGGRGLAATAALGKSYRVVRANLADLVLFWLVLVLVTLVMGVVAAIPVIGYVFALVAGVLLYPTIAIAVAYLWRKFTGGRVAPLAGVS